jgi:chromosome segregation ATPase
MNNTRGPSEGRGSSTSSSASQPSSLDVRDIDQKQLELRSAVEHRISTLERALLAREQEKASLEQQLRKLEEDYQFNYNLISERDRAIEETATYVVALDNQHKQLQHELSLARQTLKGIEQQRDAAKEQLQQQHATYEAKLIEVRRNIEGMQRTHRQELQAKETELVDLREELQASFAAQRADEDRAKSVSLAAMETAMKEQSEAAKRQERSLLSEISEWKEKNNTLRDEMIMIKQQLSSTDGALQSALGDAGQWTRRLDEQSRDLQRALQQSKEQDLVVKELQSSLSATQAKLQEVTSQWHAAQTHAEHAEQRLSVIDATKDSQASRFEEACMSMRRNFEQTISRMEETQRHTEEKVANCERDIVRHEQEAFELNGVIARSRGDVERLQEKLQDAEKLLIRSRTETEKLKRENALLEERCDSESSNQEDLTKKQTETVRSLNNKLRDLEDAMSAQSQEHIRKIQGSQSEINRLTRELQASEAARQALESQVALLRDDAGLQYQLTRTLREKADLEQRVVELERVNESIRQQVSAFTAELQNDPIVKNARASASKVTELAAQVTALETTIVDREETIRRLRVEIRRYQDELLGAQESQRTWKDLSEDHTRLRQELAESRRTSAIALGTREADGDNRTVEALQEADFWRQRAKQLETSLRSALDDCEAAKSQEADAMHALEALRSEKRSLTDVNNLLKAQLKQSYSDAAAVAQSSAILAPVLGPVAPNTISHHALAVDRVAADQQHKLAQLESTVAMLREHISTRSQSQATASRRSLSKPTLSSEARSKSTSKSNSSLSVENRGISVEGSNQQFIRRRGANTIRHYGEGASQH